MEKSLIRDVATPDQSHTPWQTKIAKVYLPSPPESSAGDQESEEPSHKRRRMSSNKGTSLPPIGYVIGQDPAEQRPVLSPNLRPESQRPPPLSPTAAHDLPTGGSVPFLPFPHPVAAQYHSRKHPLPFYGVYPYYDPRFHFSFPAYLPPSHHHTYHHRFEHGKTSYNLAPLYSHSRNSSRSSDGGSSRHSDQSRRPPGPETAPTAPQPYYQQHPHAYPTPSYGPGYHGGPPVGAPGMDYRDYSPHLLPPPSPRNMHPPSSGLYPPPGSYPLPPTIGSPYHYPSDSSSAEPYQYPGGYQAWQSNTNPSEPYSQRPFSYPHQKRRRGNLPRETTDKLRAWLNSHQSHPYPTEDEKNKMATEHGLTVQQISNWFINARRRKPAPLTPNSDKKRTSATQTAEEAEAEEDEEEGEEDEAPEAPGPRSSAR